jgi:hypothetical protein
MPEDYLKTVRIQRPTKVATDERGRTVWTGGIESVELELVSTTALYKILGSGDEKSRGEIRKAASGKTEGVLARDPASGSFEIVSDADLQAHLDGNRSQQGSHQAAEELSLVSTQMLRKVLKPDGTVEYAKDATGGKDKIGGFDPYNKS